jgi:hypothetical protein
VAQDSSAVQAASRLCLTQGDRKASDKEPTGHLGQLPAVEIAIANARSLHSSIAAPPPPNDPGAAALRTVSRDALAHPRSRRAHSLASETAGISTGRESQVCRTREPSGSPSDPRNDQATRPPRAVTSGYLYRLRKGRCVRCGPLRMRPRRHGRREQADAVGPRVRPRWLPGRSAPPEAPAQWPMKSPLPGCECRSRANLSDRQP